jgi:hypothetical protein
MRASLLTAGIIGLALAAVPAFAQSSPATAESQPTPAQVKQMAREAQTPQQFAALADYYQAQSRTYSRMASAEMTEWSRRAEMVTPLSEKWPRPADSARNLSEYYRYKAEKLAATAAQYSRMADQAMAQ